MKPRLHLTVQTGSRTGVRVSLEDGAILLGRADDCGLQFDTAGDPGVSLHHAIVQADPQGFYVADTNSTNGTFLNGSRVQSGWLSSGDRIRLGYRGPILYVMLSWVEDGAAPLETADLPLPPPPPPVDAPPATVSLKETIYSIRAYKPEKGKKDRSYAGIFFGCLGTALLSLIVFAIMVGSIGSFPGAMVGFLMAFIPAPIYLFLYLWMDRYDPEPPWLLAVSFGWGALVAIFVSFIFNTLFGSLAVAVVGGPAGNTLAAVVSAPFIEELTKGLGVVLMMVFFRKEFDSVLDGIVYAGVVALGFATVENVLYYGKTFMEAGASGLLVIGFLRGVLSPFCHSLFTSMTGVGCGLSRESYSRTARVLFPLVGWFGAMTLHGMWNLVASISGGFFLVAYFVVWLPLFTAFLILILLMARRERNMIKRTLAFETERGLITPEELRIAGSLTRRYHWLSASLNDRDKLRARQRFLRAVTKLAYCYWHVEKATAAHGSTISVPQIPEFRAEIAALRSAI